MQKSIFVKIYVSRRWMQRNVLAFLAKLLLVLRKHTILRFFIFIGNFLTRPADMNNKCPQCGLNHPQSSKACIRCGGMLDETENISSNQGLLKSSIVKRAVVCLMVLAAVFLGFYTSLIFSADKLTAEERAQVDESIRILEERGFQDEAFLLKHLAAFRANDNWLNASVAKENAYAATNFPFEIVTLYPDFFTYPSMRRNVPRYCFTRQSIYKARMKRTRTNMSGGTAKALAGNSRPTVLPRYGWKRESLPGNMLPVFSCAISTRMQTVPIDHARTPSSASRAADMGPGPPASTLRIPLGEKLALLLSAR